MKDISNTELAVTFPQIKEAMERVKSDPECLKVCTPEQLQLICWHLRHEMIDHLFLACPAIDGVRIVEKAKEIA